jgi:hypothetical protein
MNVSAEMNNAAKAAVLNECGVYSSIVWVCLGP